MKQCIAILFFSAAVFSQPNDRTLEVKGTGTYTTMPDLGVLTIDAAVINPKFAEAVKLLNQKTEQLVAQLQMIGFKKEEIKTADFSVSKNIVWENNSNIDKGYAARQTITVEFPNNKEKIASIITSFMGSENDVRFSFHFTVSDEKAKQVKNELLNRAVKDAQSSAEILAAAAQQKVGTVKRILYGTMTQTPVYQTAMLKRGMADSDQASGFDVKEMSFSDEVTIVWNLK
jgi:uncharacterized protein YggE